MQILQKKKYVSPKRASSKKAALFMLFSPTIGFFIIYSFWQRHKELTYIESIILIIILLFSALYPYVWYLIQLRKIKRIEGKWFENDYGEFVGEDAIRKIKK